MKEEKMAMCIGLSDNPSLVVEQAAHRNYPRPSILDFDFEIPFRFPSAALLLNWMMAVIGSLYSITNRTVSNKMVNY